MSPHFGNAALGSAADIAIVLVGISANQCRLDERCVLHTTLQVHVLMLNF